MIEASTPRQLGCSSFLSPFLRFSHFEEYQNCHELVTAAAAQLTLGFDLVTWISSTHYLLNDQINHLQSSFAHLVH